MRRLFHTRNHARAVPSVLLRAQIRLLVLIALCVSLMWPAFAAPCEPAREASPTVDHPSTVGPEEWSERLLAHCLDRRERWEKKLVDLERDLQATALSSEESAFPDRERSTRQKVLQKERQRFFSRLNFLAAGDKARFLESSAEQLRQAAGLRRGQEKDAFRAALELLFGDATACELGAFQATLLFAYFGVPFTEERLEQARRDEDILREVEHAFHDHVSGDTDFTPESAFAALRSAVTGEGFRYLEVLTDRLAGIASFQVAQVRQETPYGDQAAQTALQEDIRSALEQPHDNPIRRRFAESRNELDQLARQMKTFFRQAAEPARLRVYVHAKVEELESALRQNVPDEELEWLQKRVEKALYPDHNGIRRLLAWSTDNILARLDPIIEEWFQHRALPAVEKRLYDDPFSAYWFFVQTGGVARLPHAHKGSTVELSDVAFNIAALRRRSLERVLTTLEEARIPDRFLDAHEELERVLTEVTLSKEEALDVLHTAKLSEQDKRRLQDYINDPSESEMISTIDIYRWVIRDANKSQGRLNWDLVRSALALLHRAKEERLEAYVRETSTGEDGAHGERLTPYLQDAGRLMLELELRQATEDRFKEGIGGAFVGWILSRFFMGSGVPVQLWVPGGVTGPEFFELMNELVPENRESQRSYFAKSAEKISLVHDGREYHDTMVKIIDNAKNFINISAFDWKRDRGGKEIIYRLMAKKLGIEGMRFEDFVQTFSQGLPLSPDRQEHTLLFDLPSPKFKNLLLYHFFQTTDTPEIRSLREEVEELLDGTLQCPSLQTCGDLSQLREIGGTRYRAERASEPAFRSAWAIYQRLQALFEERKPSLKDTQSRRSLAEYLADSEDLRRFVRRYGLQRADAADTPFPIHVIVDAKQTLVNSSLGFSKELPFFFEHPFGELYAPLMEFDTQIVLWKGPLEFPWHIGPIPIPGRKILGVLPMPFIPYPWLNAIPGFGWAGSGMSIFLQFALASDPRSWWGRVTHTKHVSNEGMALESGMGVGSKYVNQHDKFKTWHDMGVIVEGPIVNDLNDHFVQVFNQARVNNSGLPGAKGVRIEKMKYADYRSDFDPPEAESTPELVNPSWVVTTHPEERDFNYRAVFLSALAAARKNIYLETSFFADPLVPRMLIRKAREFRGRVSCQGLGAQECSEKRQEAVDIHVILPGVSDKPIIDAIGAAEFHEMLHLGINIYRWDPPEGWSFSKMLHTKAWMVDYSRGQGALTYVGSSNATQRSHIQDNEVGIVSTSDTFADEVYERLFEQDMTEDSRVESVENFHIAFETNPAIRASRWIRRFLVNFLWII